MDAEVTRPPARSLRFRLLAGTLLAMSTALILAGVALSALFRDHVLRQFAQTLTVQLDQLTARLDFDAAGMPQVDLSGLSDPRWTRPYSGLYWQVQPVEPVAPDAPARMLRSRSLWDATLQVPADVPARGDVHRHEVAGPQHRRLLLVERRVVPEALETLGGSAGASGEASGARPPAWRVMVAAELGETEAAISRFDGVLAGSVGVLMVLLAAAAVAQVAIGLAPLRTLQRALADVREGRAPRLHAPVPAEVQPLVESFNAVLAHDAEVVARARTQAGNLAHALKTPLAALAQAAAAARPGESAAREALPGLVAEQVELARRHIDWHLARARAAAAHAVPGVRTAVDPALAALVRVMQRVHAERHLQITCGRPQEPQPGAASLSFAGESQDLHEIAGNLLDNACKWALTTVQVQAWSTGSGTARRLHLAVDDDGPGIEPARREAVLARGTRLDESVPGSGLGLAIAQELATLYGGRIGLAGSTLGGLRVEVELPAAQESAGG